ncbi:uroporphyrinogen-III decarboxylase [Anaerosolibacter carboniphilus]|uniref:Uroporphyrinogen-III decarboxylase n=1 Tax=Anaerosolibacter carboniphilus TaxID=1417629 RepID=A0A841L8G4_9FIRM|nr:uroporphyrinogen decarboxylase family protein [Anaerosolibacter carboniphilus]MBB6218555.1 uroporphyrinogen-III decarboxylase [Anaerosolibacter carboniphilus]
MEYTVTFKCEGENLEQIPESIMEQTGIRFPEAHLDQKQMMILAKELKKYKKDQIVRIPFCVTVEAEALGGQIKLGDDKIGPRVDQYLFSAIEELEGIKEIDLNTGRIKEVLDAVEGLSVENETVALNVEGPFTIISSLIDPMIFYKGIRKNKELIDKFMKVIEDNIVEYILAGIKRGAKIISYGDPVGSLDIVGPKVYQEISGRTTYNVLKRIEPFLSGRIVHLCGKTSTAFDKLGFSESHPIEMNEELTYGEAILQLMKDNQGIQFIGHACIKKTPFKMKKSIVWNICLK